MTFGSKKLRTILVVGRNSAAAAVVNALSAVAGVGVVRQLGEFHPINDSAKLAGADMIVDMVGGVAPAFATAMAALGNGTAFVTANPLLIAAHGRVLRNAAQGQQTYFGFQAAGFGLPIAEMMAAARPTKVTVSFSTAASMALARMAFRNESLAHVSAHLKMRQVDLSDWGGKLTLARAMALRAQLFDDELRGQQLVRAAVEQVEPADVRRLRQFGLQPVFGAEITEEKIYAGPMAVAPGHALLNVGTTDGMDVLVAETAHGEIVMSQTADDTARILAGVVADVRQYLRAQRPALTVDVREFGVKAKAGHALAYVRVPFAAREQVLALKPEIVQELVEGDGLWQAVVAVNDVSSIKVNALGGMVMPLNGDWQAPVTGSAFGGLRLVG